MSDFLRHLIANELETSASVAPRTPTLFETALRSTEPMIEATPRVPHARPEVERQETVHPGVSPTPAVEGRAQAVSPAIPPLDRRTDALVSVVRTLTEPASASALAMSAPQESVVHRDPPPQLVVHEHKQMLQPSIVRIATPAVAAAGRTVLPARRESEPNPDVPILRAPTTPQVASSVLRAAMPTPLEAPVEASRTVQISIGRLEIRASAPAPTRARRETAPQPSRVEQYLASRGRSERQ